MRTDFLVVLGVGLLWVLPVIAAAPGGAATGPATSATAAAEHRFEKEVRAYEAEDKAQMPPKGAILLAGDSQFFRWKTVKEDLAGYTVINRGIDSLEMSDLLYYADRLVLPYKPRLIVTHIGGNDIHNQKKPEQMLADFQAFVAKVRAAQPDVPIVFSSLTPGPARIAEADTRQKANALVKAWVDTQMNMGFINLWDAMMGPDGKPREDIWVEDRIHPNHEGYLIRVKLTLPFLGEPDLRIRK